MTVALVSVIRGNRMEVSVQKRGKETREERTDPRRRTGKMELEKSLSKRREGKKIEKVHRLDGTYPR